MTSPSLTRRRILAAVGSAGALYFGVDRAGAALGLDPVDLNQHTVNGTYAQPTEFVNAPPRVGLAWRETVNGEVREETSLSADGETGAVGLIVDEAVMPGDSGSVTMRARLLEREDQETANAQLYLRFRLSETGENGINEPEREAGDDTPDAGELDDLVQIRIWKDEDEFGSGDGDLTWGSIPFVGDTELTDGWQSLAAVAEDDALTDGSRISTCLDPAEDPEIYVSFRWEFPQSMPADLPWTDPNVAQGDSAVFQVGFEPRPCGGD